jgi:L-alanine-DL-glutamate epimerase-like enolase superfamily enzyme
MRIRNIEVRLCDVASLTAREDAIQAFSRQETILVDIGTEEGLVGTGYAYTIGTGGRAVFELLRNDLLGLVIGNDARQIEAIWQRLFWATHATAVGPITNLALAAVDIALWDLRGKTLGQPLWLLAGGARTAVPLYDTECGWLNLDVEELVERTKTSAVSGFRGVKVKVGKTDAHEDLERLLAVRKAIGPGVALMIDANQAFTSAEARRRAQLFEEAHPVWFEEPLPAEDLSGHVRLAASTNIPVAVGESIYSPQQFREYLTAGAVGIIQPDAARIGGITPWLKTGHLAEAFNVNVAPHFLMELHVSLCAAIPNSLYVEHLPQLRPMLRSQFEIVDGCAIPPSVPGVGIDWNREVIAELATETAEIA